MTDSRHWGRGIKIKGSEYSNEFLDGGYIHINAWVS